MSFLYSRSSNDIGKGVPLSDAKLAHLYASAPSKSSVARKLGHVGETSDPKDFMNVSVSANQLVASETVVPIEKVLNSYSHQPKPQNPLYATSQNEHGIKKPTVATYTAERCAMDQKFSASFNSQMPRDQGLNTSLTRSNCHSELDPQFA